MTTVTRTNADRLAHKAVRQQLGLRRWWRRQLVSRLDLRLKVVPLLAVEALLHMHMHYSRCNTEGMRETALGHEHVIAGVRRQVVHRDASLLKWLRRRIHHPDRVDPVNVTVVTCNNL